MTAELSQVQTEGGVGRTGDDSKSGEGLESAVLF